MQDMIINFDRNMKQGNRNRGCWNFLSGIAYLLKKGSFRITENKYEFYSNWADFFNLKMWGFFHLFLHIVVETSLTFYFEIPSIFKMQLGFIFRSIFKKLKIKTPLNLFKIDFLGVIIV